MFNNKIKKVVSQVNKEFGKLFDWANGTHTRLNYNFTIANKNFKGLNEDVSNLYDLQERLGQKVKDQKIDIQMILMGILKKLDLVVNENGCVEELKTIKIKKDVKPKAISTPTKTTKRKSK